MNKNDGVDILLVEDNKDDVEMMLYALKQKNITNNIFIVNDGAEALDFIFGRNSYHGKINIKKTKLILLDLNLPLVSGIEVLQVLKNNEETKTIPVVVLTTSKEESDVKKCYQFGVNSYIVKPLNYQKFIEAVNTIGLYWLSLNYICN